MESQFIERNILIGMITSTDFIQAIVPLDLNLFESKTAKKLAGWIVEYFDKYNKAPGKDIEPIFFSKSKKLPDDVVEDIADILESLSEDSDEHSINIDYLRDEAATYFNERALELYIAKIKDLLSKGDILGAENAASNYKATVKTNDWIDFSDEKILDEIDAAFSESDEYLIEFPGALGEMWNEHFVRGGFFAIQAIEKSGKTFWLLELAMRAFKQKRNVAFFQAGDMTSRQQIIRSGIYLTRKSNKVKYCGKMFEPVRDCIHNQNDSCRKNERACTFGCFPGQTKEYLREELTAEELKEAYLDAPDYIPCTDCDEYKRKEWGMPWLKEVDMGEVPLNAEEAKNAIQKSFFKKKRKFRLASYPTGTLTMKTINGTLDLWEKDGFMADVVIIDYPDIMDAPEIKEHRHKQNTIWMGVRGMTQKRKCLGIIVTQADAKAYEKHTQTRSNFSEDKRKYAHPTAFFALNQDKFGREKALGIMRISELVIREGESTQGREVRVIQNLKRGRPFISSYW